MVVKLDFDKCCWKNNKCVRCGCGGSCNGCVEVCPAGALIRADVIKIDQDKCIGCGACVDACEYGAISLD